MAQEIGFIGLGAMGQPMAANLIRAGYSLKVYNRTASKADKLVELGAELVSNPADVATSGGIVVSMVADDAAIEGMVIGTDTMADRLGPGGIHLSMSTIAAATSRRLAEYHAARNSIYVTAPVFGRPDAAEARRLWICVSGPERANERLKPIYEALGQEVYDFGDEVGAANVVKLAGNFMIGAAMEAMGEAFAMVEKSGVDRIKAAEMLIGTLFACPVYKGYGNAIAHLRHRPAGFPLRLGLKDFKLALRSATEAQSPMPLASIAHDRTLSGLAKGRGEMDWSALALGAREDAGLGTEPDGDGKVNRS